MNAQDRPVTPVNAPAGWTRSSWRTKTALQQPTYPDPEALAAVGRELEALPPLVTSWEVLALKRQIAVAEVGMRFFMQGGDCAESFAD